MGCMNLISDTWVKLTKCAYSTSRTCHGSDTKHDQRWAQQATGNSYTALDMLDWILSKLEFRLLSITFVNMYMYIPGHPGLSCTGSFYKEKLTQFWMVKLGNVS